MTWDDNGYYEAAFGICRSRRYHDYMRDHYRRLNDTIVAASAITGSAAFLSLMPASPNIGLAKVLTAIVGIGSLLNLVLGFGKKADKHDSLARQFVELSAKLHELDATPDNLRAIKAERLRIEADEPPVRRLIDLWAHNDESSARGVLSPRGHFPLTFWQRSVFAYHFTWGAEAARRKYEAGKVES